MSGDRTSSHGVAPVKSAERTIVILEYLSSSPEARSLREITHDLDLPRASAYALLTTLLQRGWVEYSDGRYRLGVRSLRASAHFVEMDETVRETTNCGPIVAIISRIPFYQNNILLILFIEFFFLSFLFRNCHVSSAVDT